MRTYLKVLRDADSRVPFANSTESEAWQSAWCWRDGAPCAHDTMDRGGKLACPLLDVAMLELKTPREWGHYTAVLGHGMYTCSEYLADTE
jgi:hypothetical protein